MPVKSRTMKHETRRPLIVSLLAVALSLALVGCGAQQGGGERSASETSGAEQSSASQSGTTQAPSAQSGPERSAQEQSVPKSELPPPAEPEDSPPVETEPEGEIIQVGSEPEGIVADPESGLVAVGVRDPDQLALVDGESADVVRRVDLPQPLRHLQLAAPGGPILAPDERSGQLFRIGLPGGKVLSQTDVGEFPHDASAAPNGRIFVTNEFGDDLSVVDDGRVIETLETPVQPGGVDVAGDAVGALGVRGNALQVYDSKSLRSLGTVDSGDGPTHLEAYESRFYVADTRGDQILVFRASPEPELVGRMSLPGSPYGLSLDPRRGQLWVTLTGRDQVVGLSLDGDKPREVSRYPTVRQPNTVAVNPESGRVFVAGRAGGELQIIDPQ